MLGSILLLQIGQVIGRVLYLLFAMWYLNRYLGLEAKGAWTAGYALLGILSVTSNMGFEVWLSRAAAADRIDARSAIRTLFRIKTPLWLLSLAVGAGLTLERGTGVALAIPFGLALIFDGIGLAQQAVFEGKGKAGAMALMSFLKSGGFAIAALTAALLVAEPSLGLFGWIYAATLGLRTLVGRVAWRLLPQEPGPAYKGALKEFFLLGAYTMVTVLYFQVDAVMLSHMIGDAATGDYGNAYHYVEGALFISAAVGAVIFPRLVSADNAHRADLFDRFFKLLLVIAAHVVVGIWLLGEWVGELLVGPEFQGAVQPMLMLAPGLPIMFANGLLSRWLFAVHAERFALITAAMMAVFNIVGNALLIPEYGASGAAIMTVATEGLLFLIWVALGRGSIRLLWFPAMIAAILGLIAWLHLGLDRPLWALTAAVLILPALLLQTARQAHLVGKLPG